MIEVHCAVARTPQGKAGANLDAIMASAVDEAKEVKLGDSRFLTLSPGHQAIALLMHMQKHMTSSGIGLKQLCDWMMFAASVSVEEWTDILPLLQQTGLKKYAQIMTKTCVLYLGMPLGNCAWCAMAEDEICHLAIEDIFRSGNITARKSAQGFSSMFLEDVGHFSSPFRGELRKFHLLLYRLNQYTMKKYSHQSRIIPLRPVLWLVCGAQYIRKQNGLGELAQGQRIARERNRGDGEQLSQIKANRHP